MLKGELTMHVVKHLPLVSFLVCLLFAQPALAADESSASDLFGFGQGNVHPSVELSSTFTDNYYSTSSDAESDLQTTISPSLWLSLPASDELFIPLVSSTSSAGGQGVTRFQSEGATGFQGALYYGADLEYHNDHSDDDMVSHQGQGVMQYSLASGLAFELSDAYEVSSDSYSDGSGKTLNDYSSNLANGILYYQVSEQLKLRTGYSLYALDYDEQDNEYKDRSDQQFSAYILYQLLPKTETFVQYETTATDYDLDSRSDRTSENYYVGVKFDSNAKVTGYAKLGYGVADAEDADEEDCDALVGEAQIGYVFGNNYMLSLNLDRELFLSTDSDYLSDLGTTLTLGLAHQLSHKLGSSVYLMAKTDDYQGGSSSVAREDDTFGAGLAFDYTMQEWLIWNLGYDYSDRDSNVEGSDYQSQMVSLGVTAAF
jgi:hypothetical protein